MKPKVLVVDDDNTVRSMLCDFLSDNGYMVDQADGFTEACRLADSDDYDIILTDKNYNGFNNNSEGGLDLLQYIRRKHLSSEVIMITGHPSITTAIKAMKLGAFDYIQKPFSLKELQTKLTRLIEYRRFIDHDMMLELYRNIRHTILALMSNKSSRTEYDTATELANINIKLDLIFTTFKEYERVTLALRESLAKISTISEELLLDNKHIGNDYLMKEIRHLASSNL